MSNERVITYHYPTLQKGEDGKWRPASIVVGKILPDGRIENTPYKFKRRKICGGGLAITDNSTLERLPNGDLQNPATKERFKPTKKGTGFWSRLTGTFVPKPYLERRENNGESEEG